MGVTCPFKFNNSHRFLPAYFYAAGGSTGRAWMYRVEDEVAPSCSQTEDAMGGVTDFWIPRQK